MDISIVKEFLKDWKDGKIRFRESGFKKRNLEMYKWINDNITGVDFSSKITLASHGLYDTPKCEKCKEKISKSIFKKIPRFCSYKCNLTSDDSRKKKTKKMIELYGVENNFQSGVLRDKIYETCIDKFGVKTPMQGSGKDRWKTTMFEKYGTDHNFKDPDVQDKISETNLRKYGVKRPAQDLDMMKKILGSRDVKTVKYPETNLVYMSTLEKYFLDLMKESEVLDRVSQGPCFHYIFNNEKKLYKSDFFIQDLDLVIEIKSFWTYDSRGADKDKQKQNEAKWESAKKIHNFIVLFEKDQIKNFVDGFK